MQDVFSADTIVESLGRPTVVIEGKQYVGRPMSVLQWFQILKRMDNLASKSGDDVLKIYADVVRLMFGSSRWKFWQKNVPKLIINHPAFLQMVAHFLEVQSKYTPNLPKTEQK